MFPGKMYTNVLSKAKPVWLSDNDWGVCLACINVGAMLVLSSILIALS